MKKNYYAIKIGNNVKDLIVDSLENWKNYVIGYPSLYKGKVNNYYMQQSIIEQAQNLLNSRNNIILDNEKGEER